MSRNSVQIGIANPTGGALLFGTLLLLGCPDPLPGQAVSDGSACSACSDALDDGGDEGNIVGAGDLSPLPDAAAPDGAMHGGTRDGGTRDGGGTRLPGGVPAPPDPHLVLNHSRLAVLGTVQTNWAVDVALNAPAASPATVGTLGACTFTNTAGAPGTVLDAGDLTVTGGPNGPLSIAIDPLSGTYEVVQNLDDPGDGSLFTSASVLSLGIRGGRDIHTITQGGPWRGVTLLNMGSPQSLSSLPSADLHLTWTAAPRADTTMEVSLQSQQFHIDCPVAGDPGSYTVPKAVVDVIPGGPVYILVSRLLRATAATAPDHGAVRLESRSSWQIITHR